MTFSRQIRTLLGNRRGYTLDQTILIVAIIAIIITLVVVTLGWQLMRRSSGTKLASQMRQVEDAMGQFYATYHVWPTQAFVSGPSVHAAHNALLAVVNSQDIVFIPSVAAMERKNLLPGMVYDAGGVLTTYGKIGSGSNTGYAGVAEVENPTADKVGKYLVLYWHDVPFGDVLEMEYAIDGGGNPDFGRGKITATAGNGDDWFTSGASAVLPTTPVSTLVNVTYIANPL